MALGAGGRFNCIGACSRGESRVVLQLLSRGYIQVFGYCMRMGDQVVTLVNCGWPVCRVLRLLIYIVHVVFR